MAEYIEREALLKSLCNVCDGWCENTACDCVNCKSEHRCDMVIEISEAPAADVVPVVHGYRDGDVCIYGFGHENKSRALVEIVRILNDERGVAEVKFHKVFVDDTGNGFFNYLLKSGGTMNASFQYLKNITPRMDGD